MDSAISKTLTRLGLIIVSACIFGCAHPPGRVLAEKINTLIDLEGSLAARHPVKACLSSIFSVGEDTRARVHEKQDIFRKLQEMGYVVRTRTESDYEVVTVRRDYDGAEVIIFFSFDIRNRLSDISISFSFSSSGPMGGAIPFETSYSMVGTFPNIGKRPATTRWGG